MLADLTVRGHEKTAHRNAGFLLVDIFSAATRTAGNSKQTLSRLFNLLWSVLNAQWRGSRTRRGSRAAPRDIESASVVSVHRAICAILDIGEGFHRRALFAVPPAAPSTARRQHCCVFDSPIANSRCARMEAQLLNNSQGQASQSNAVANRTSIDGEVSSSTFSARVSTGLVVHTHHASFSPYGSDFSADDVAPLGAS